VAAVGVAGVRMASTSDRGSISRRRRRTMRFRTIGAVALAMFGLSALGLAAKEDAPSAASLLAAAQKQAADQKKNVLIISHASW